ncbi:MAG: hypothetical protein LBJ09_01635 [Clostridiales bacterium]|nr:hypothetical protein [Clostridiales bacterium]
MSATLHLEETLNFYYKQIYEQATLFLKSSYVDRKKFKLSRNDEIIVFLQNLSKHEKRLAIQLIGEKIEDVEKRSVQIEAGYNKFISDNNFPDALRSEVFSFFDKDFVKGELKFFKRGSLELLKYLQQKGVGGLTLRLISLIDDDTHSRRISEEMGFLVVILFFKLKTLRSLENIPEEFEWLEKPAPIIETKLSVFYRMCEQRQQAKKEESMRRTWLPKIELSRQMNPGRSLEKFVEEVRQFAAEKGFLAEDYILWVVFFWDKRPPWSPNPWERKREPISKFLNQQAEVPRSCKDFLLNEVLYSRPLIDFDSSSVSL